MMTLWLLLPILGACSAAIHMQERYSWNVLDWSYPDDYSRQQDLLSGALVPENALPVGIERWRNKLFVLFHQIPNSSTREVGNALMTPLKFILSMGSDNHLNSDGPRAFLPLGNAIKIDWLMYKEDLKHARTCHELVYIIPRQEEQGDKDVVIQMVCTTWLQMRKAGFSDASLFSIPATLNYIALDAPYDPSPKLAPYPSWKGNELGNCEYGLNTVYRIKADRCDRLWVLDTGTYGYDNTTTNPCPYALNVYDLNTDQRIRRYVLRAEDIVPSTFIANIAVDVGKDCDDTFAYMSDELGYGLIAYSWEENKSWRFSHSYFMPDPLKGDFNIAGMNFQWGSEGIFGIALSSIGANGYRTLYFSPLASHTEFEVSTQTLRDEKRVSDSYRDFKVVGTRGADSHLTAKVMSEDGVQLFNLIDQNAIGCWNSELSYKPQNIAIVEKDDVGLIFPSDVKIDDDQNVWAISDRMSIFLEAELDYSDINFRIYTAPLRNLIEETVCQPSRASRVYSNNLLQSKNRIASIPSIPYTYYDTRLGSPNLSGSLHATTPLPKATYVSSPFAVNELPKVSSYFTLHKQPSYPYGVPTTTNSNDLNSPTYYQTFSTRQSRPRQPCRTKEITQPFYE
ncbi:Protein yellow [Eumeta japonica]|uniref:Protein yellow n=1 Tax=Eumeta variegata TaxID=151549 RepID=A0A4C1XTC4_EUMVA|nr:Protein yellow [Eumeta japonica]